MFFPQSHMSHMIFFELWLNLCLRTWIKISCYQKFKVAPVVNINLFFYGLILLLFDNTN